MSKNLKHTDFVSQLSNNAMIDNAYGQFIIDEIINTIATTLINTQRIEIRYFGAFTVKSQQKRTSLDRDDYKTTTILSFKPTKALKL